MRDIALFPHRDELFRRNFKVSKPAEEHPCLIAKKDVRGIINKIGLTDVFPLFKNPFDLGPALEKFLGTFRFLKVQDPDAPFLPQRDLPPPGIRLIPFHSLVHEAVRQHVRKKLAFGSPEIFILAILGISFVALMGRGSMTKALVAAALGVMMAFVGVASGSGQLRYTMGSLYFYGGKGDRFS